MPAVFTAVNQGLHFVHGEKKEDDEWCTSITEDQQGFANHISQYTRNCYLTMMGGQVDEEDGTSQQLTGKMIRLRAAMLLPGRVISISALLHKKVNLGGERWTANAKAKNELLDMFQAAEKLGLGSLKKRSDEKKVKARGATKQDFHKATFEDSNDKLKTQFIRMNIDIEDYKAAFDRQDKYGSGADPIPRPSTTKKELVEKSRPPKRLRDADATPRKPLADLKPNTMIYTPPDPSAGGVSQLSLDLPVMDNEDEDDEVFQFSGDDENSSSVPFRRQSSQASTDGVDVF